MTRDPEHDVTEADTSALLAAARMAGRTAEAARLAMLEASADRAQALLQLHTMGMSIREIASRLDVAPTVVANAINRARSST